MANLNLSEFTEKLFVADADHTFIWDTAASISKRVSRNSWLSGTTADFHLGLADAATAVAQTISVQSVVAGTSNTAGANLSINGSQGTGTGAGGSLLLRTAPAGSSGTAQNALVTAVAITSAGNVGIGTTAPGAKLQVVGNAIFGENSISTSIVNVSFGGSYGTAVAGSKANLKWDLFNDGAGNRSGLGISSGVFEFQVGTGAGFGFYPNGGTTSALQIISSGNVGIGTTSPTSKLQVTGGDVEIETVTSGIIMKAAGTATRYRITLNAGGTDLVFTAI
jgi:hypothetical protein